MGGVNQGNSRVERCVLKEEIVFVWLELVQKTSPNSKCSQSVVYDEFGLVNRKREELTKVGMCAKGGNSVCLEINCPELGKNVLLQGLANSYRKRKK